MGSLRSLAADEAQDRRLRVCDFHNASVAGKKLALARPMVDFFAHVFREQVVAMQSLTFRYGSEQDVHQDHAYVVPGNPAHLGAAWIALEDIHPDAGPVGYFPGSHRIRKFDWGNGLFYDEQRSTRWHFQEHILAECARLGLELQTFLPRKGDVFLWHGRLAHGGTPQRDPSRTRLSLAVHYSSVRAYPRASRRSDVPPTRYLFNGAVVYGDPTKPEIENSFTRGFSAETGELFLVEEP
jgi:ectoine hydroxylase-related dioxygenase (phytanoyl-CoA dioxygenase family)